MAMERSVDQVPDAHDIAGPEGEHHEYEGALDVVPTFAHVSVGGPDRLCELLGQLLELFESGELSPP